MSETSQSSATRTIQSPLGEKLGMRFVSAHNGVAEYALPYDVSNTTVADVVHGGAILSLADVAATAAVWSTVAEPDKYRGLTIDLSLSFVTAARRVDLVAKAHVLKRGRSVCYCDVRVESDTGELIAKAQVTYKMSRMTQPADAMTALFEGKSRAEQMALLAQLERTGAAMYRRFAEGGVHTDALLASAAREEANAEVLEALAKGAGDP